MWTMHTFYTNTFFLHTTKVQIFGLTLHAVCYEMLKLRVNLQKPVWQLSTLLLLAFIWGSSFILMKRGMDVYPAEQVAALRIFIAFLSLLPFFFIHLNRIPQDKLKFFFIVGLFGNGIPAFLFTAAQEHISSSLSGMLNSLTPLFTLLLGMALFGMHVKGRQVAGVLIGLCGALGLIWAGGSVEFGNNLRYGLLVVAATMCYAISVNTIKTHLQQIDAVIVTSMAFMFLGVPLGIYLFSGSFLSISLNHTGAGTALGYVAVLSTIGTSGAVLLFNYLIKHTSALFASSVTYLIPIAAIGWGIADGEQINLLHLLFILVVLFGVYLVNRK